MDKTVVLGITGSIAAYKAAEIGSCLKKQGVDVFPVLTANACRFITPLTMETVCGRMRWSIFPWQSGRIYS